jgi:ABC-type transport system involved in multi-copper enzyme maturation permease subunit
MSDIIKAVVLILVVVAIVIGGPLMTITALNELFGMKIEFTFMTWLSAFWLSAIAAGGVTTKYNKKD